jgi:subtilisin family serine protease
MIKVAVIDSGVNDKHPHIARVSGGAVIAPCADSYLDILGHGTAVMAAIQEKAPSAEYYAVKVFHDTFRTSITQLIEAITWALDHRMDVINLSLGTRNPAHAASFTPLIDAALAQGSVLVSAIEAQGERAYPGSLPGVIGVGVDINCPRDQFRHDSGVFLSSPYPRSLPGVPVERNLSGISFAVANMSGIIANALMHTSAGQLREALLAQPIR